MLDLSGLNAAQRAAVTAEPGPLLVIAGAGSGKTRTLVHRLAWLAEQGVDPSSMLLLTFTRKASQEMLHRAANLLGYSLGGVHGGTFHGFAFSILRQYRPDWATGALTVMDASDSASALQQCRERFKIGKHDRSFPKAQTVLGMISKARNKELELHEVLQRDAPHLMGYAGDLCLLDSACREYRREHSLLDYDDLLFELEALLRKDGGESDLALQLQARFSQILVDEYQDTNRVQARLVRLLAGERGNVMAVGDDAQSIYAFRGADVRNILQFCKVFPQASLLRLEENYRSVQPVLDVANAVLASASEGYAKTLFTQRQGGAPVRLLRPLSDLSQASVVAQRIEELLETYQPPEIAVLFRAGYQSYHLEVALTKRGIPFQKYGGLRYAEASHIKDVVAFVRLLVNPMDQPSFLRMAALCKGVGARTAEKLHARLAAGDLEGLRSACARFPELLLDLALLDRLRAENPTPALLLGRLVDAYRPRLERLYPDDWPRRLQGLEELTHIASAYSDNEKLVADLSLDSPDPKAEHEADSIVLSTIHSAKGLEWDAVIVIDLVEERFPSRHALVRPEDFEEERRLMYVACTRARESLDLSAPSTLYNRQNAGNQPAELSPFLRELPYGLCEEWQEGFTGVLSQRPSLQPSARVRSVLKADIGRPLSESGTFGSPTTFSADTFAPNSPGSRSTRPPSPTTPAAPRSGEECGFCRHKIFGRGKVVEHLPPDKCRVNFPGLGLKVILRDFLIMEE